MLNPTCWCNSIKDFVLQTISLLFPSFAIPALLAAYSTYIFLGYICILLHTNNYGVLFWCLPLQYTVTPFNWSGWAPIAILWIGWIRWTVLHFIWTLWLIHPLRCLIDQSRQLHDCWPQCTGLWRRLARNDGIRILLSVCCFLRNTGAFVDMLRHPMCVWCTCSPAMCFCTW